jgi:hypothetical protein
MTQNFIEGETWVMKRIHKFLALSLAFLAFSFVNANAQALSGGPSAATIAGQVAKKILRLPRYEVFDHIGFTVEGSTVTLTGKVRNAINKSDAEGTVKRIPGVRSVINNIEVLPLASFDEQIRRNLYRSLSNTGGLSRYLWPVNPPVRLIVERGRITLEGTVSNRGDYNTMNIIASGVPGSFGVTNNLKIANDVPR